MPDLILSSAMDSFLSESDPANVLLPLTGGIMGSGADIAFANGSMLREGTTDAGNGGAGGIAQVCSISYELKWEAGRLYVMEQDGFTIRVEQYGFTSAPTSGDDDTKGYIVGSQRILDDGTTYVCTDATTGAALWVPVIDFSSRRLYAPNGTPALEWGVDFSTGDYGIAFGYDGMSGFYHLLNSQGINWAGGSWYDGITIGYGSYTAIDISYRQLIANDGATVMLDWSSSSAGVALANGIPLGVDIIFDAGSPLNYIDMVNGEIGGYTGSYVPSIDWIDRQLKDASGNTTVEWANLSLYAVNVLSLDWSSRNLRDSGGLHSLAWDTRQLLGTDGSTVAVDWSSGIPVTPRATLTPNTVAALTGGEGTIAYVNDADTPVTHGQPVVGGGAEKALVCFNGTDWIIVSHLS